MTDCQYPCTCKMPNSEFHFIHIWRWVLPQEYRKRTFKNLIPRGKKQPDRPHSNDSVDSISGWDFKPSHSTARSLSVPWFFSHYIATSKTVCWQGIGLTQYWRRSSPFVDLKGWIIVLTLSALKLWLLHLNWGSPQWKFRACIAGGRMQFSCIRPLPTSNMPGVWAVPTNFNWAYASFKSSAGPVWINGIPLCDV